MKLQGKTYDKRYHINTHIFNFIFIFFCVSQVFCLTGEFFIDNIQHSKIINVKIIVYLLIKGRQLTLFMTGP